MVDPGHVRVKICVTVELRHDGQRLGIVVRDNGTTLRIPGSSTAGIRVTWSIVRRSRTGPMP
jgi:hypothetical protein